MGDGPHPPRGALRGSGASPIAARGPPADAAAMAEPGDTNTSTRKLVRLPDDGHIAGVCAGLARFLNVDPLLVRIAAFILLISGPGFFLYLAAWIFVPSADGTMLVEQVKPLPEDK